MRLLRIGSLTLGFVVLAAGARAQEFGTDYTFGANFTGSNIDQAGFIPPDSTGAIGPSSFVELVNGVYAVYDRAGANLARTSLDQFWNTAGITQNNGAFDPRILWDPTTSRFFALSAEFPSSSRISRAFVAVSNTSNPLDGWKATAFNTDPDTTHWFDFPTFGMNGDSLYVAGNMFPNSSGNVNPAVFKLPKADLLAATPSTANMTSFYDQNPVLTGFSAQPAVDLDARTGVERLLSAYNGDFDGQGYLKRSSVVDSGTSAAISDDDVTMTPVFSIPPDAVQKGSSQTISTNDDRFSSSVVAVGDSLWAVHAVDAGGKSGARWYRIDADTSNLLETGLITDTSLAFYYPSIAVNQLGDVVIGMSGSDANTYASTYVVVGKTTGGVTSFGSVKQIQAGLGSYYVTFGGSENRFGDYSATMVDPTNPKSFWTIQEYASATNKWSTRITQINLNPVPEPATMVALGAGLLALARRRRRH